MNKYNEKEKQPVSSSAKSYSEENQLVHSSVESQLRRK